MKKIIMTIALLSNTCYAYGVKGMRHGVRSGSLDGLPPEAILLIIGIIVVVAIICGIYYLYSQSENEKENELAKQRAEKQYEHWVNCANTYNKLNTCNTKTVPEVIPEKNEYVFGYADSILCELRSVRNGSYGGVSFRICKGVSYHTGGTKGESHDELRAISQGKLVITNNRIVFIGPGLKREVKMDKITSINAGWDYIEISATGRQKSMFFANINGNICRDMIDNIIQFRNDGHRGEKFLDVWKSNEEIFYRKEN